jgi:hypothetical protein
MYNETYAPILSVIERDFVRGDAAHGGGVAQDVILGANIQDYTRAIERLRAMRVRVVHAGTIQASVKNGCSSGRRMARAIAKVAQVLADASPVASAGQTRTYELCPLQRS